MREYRELKRQLERIKKDPSQSLLPPVYRVRRALNWPFLLSNEQMILSVLDEQFRTLQQTGKVTKNVLNLWLEGVAILLKNRATGGNISDWLMRARLESSEGIFSW